MHSIRCRIPYHHRFLPIISTTTTRAPWLQYLHPKGAELVLCEPNTAAREAAVAEIVRERGMTSVSPYNDYDVMAGQGTLALELIEQVWWPGGKLSRW